MAPPKIEGRVYFTSVMKKFDFNCDLLLSFTSGSADSMSSCSTQNFVAGVFARGDSRTHFDQVPALCLAISPVDADWDDHDRANRDN
jgi:hypothetical protein